MCFYVTYYVTTSLFYVTAMTKNTGAFGTEQHFTTDVERVQNTAKYGPQDSVEVDQIRGHGLEK